MYTCVDTCICSLGVCCSSQVSLCLFDYYLLYSMPTYTYSIHVSVICI